MNPARLRDFTAARVAIGRTGISVPTRELLDFQLAHARARDAVYAGLDAPLLARELRERGLDSVIVHSAAPDRATYLRRPGLGRTLHADSRSLLGAMRGEFDAVFVVADGLSALAIHRHTAPMLEAVRSRIDPAEWNFAPIVIVEQARVAVGDEIGSLLGASLAIVMIGERPGLSAPDSLGIYLTWNPAPGCTDAARNCISNVRPEGLSYAVAAGKLVYLMRESRHRKLSGVQLREAAPVLERGIE
jgi:ethanolamine ammonia-lyase small subunit